MRVILRVTLGTRRHPVASLPQETSWGATPWLALTQKWHMAGAPLFGAFPQVMGYPKSSKSLVT